MLTDTLLRGLKGKEKRQKIFDGGGLYILVKPNGSRLWRMAYRFDGKPKTLSFGSYDYVSLKVARGLRNEAKELLAKGIDPSVNKQALKEARKAKAANSFEVLTFEWIANNKNKWGQDHAEKIISSFKNDVLPVLGAMPIENITAPQLLDVLRRIVARGAIDTAHRVKQNCGCVFRYAIATGRAKRDITYELKGALPPAKSKHFAAITEPKAVGELLRGLEAYNSNVILRAAMRILPYVFVRSNELREAEWAEFDFDNALWHIPAKRMKMKQKHIVPLAQQVIDILQDLRQYTGDGRYVFPSFRTKSGFMPAESLLNVLRRMGYSGEEMTIHGFRGMASTLLNSMGCYNHDWIERQLAHSEANDTRAAYNHSDYLPQRKQMMQDWADYLDKLRES